jgi:hypothetical protein
MLHLVDIMAAKAVEHYAVDNSIPYTKAAKYFITTNTYRLLCNPESYLALESVEYILDMLDAEEKCDVKRWMAI